MPANNPHKISTLVALTALVTCFLNPGPVLAQLIDVAQCVAIEDRLTRADCYDAQVAQQSPPAVDAPLTPDALPEALNPQEPQTSEQRETQPVREVLQIVKEPLSAPPTPPVPPVPPVPPSALEQFESFGFSTRAQAIAEGEDELHDRVSALTKRGLNKWLITLESSGQVWYQTNSDLFRLREGMEIIIYPSSFGGSFRLRRSTQNGFIQVHRVE